MADEQQQIADAHAVLQAAEELEQNAEQFQQWGHDSASASCRARAYELRQVLHRLIPAIGVQATARGATVDRTKPCPEFKDCADPFSCRKACRCLQLHAPASGVRVVDETTARAAMTSTTEKE